MYSMLLAAALSTATTTPGWCKKHRHHHAPPPPPPVCCVPVGCCGGCFGCCGGCFGCCGGCSGCCGGCFGCCGGCFGCYGGYGATAAIPTSAPAVSPAPVAAAPLPTQGTVIVNLPADAKMFVDGREAHLTSASRSFTTPTLQQGRDYYYTIKAQANRDGETRVQSARLVVRAGQTARVDFGDMSSSRLVSATLDDGAAPAIIKVRLPQEARLYLNGVQCPSTSITTAKLLPGRDYAYTLKAEVVENGEVRSEIRRVVFRSGKEVTVDFGELTLAQAGRR